jgi:3-phenylpropionate/cinnamic acid dioxygenase small subunit
MSRTKAIGVPVIAVAIAGFSWMHAETGSVMKLTADDYIQIQQLYAAYAHALDTGQGEKFAATFVEDGEFTGGRPTGRANEVRTPRRGKEALTEMGSRGGTRHFTANLIITPTADGAKGSCYLLLFNARNIPATISETAIYDDTLVKTAQGWKFKKRVVWRDDDDITPFKPKPLSQTQSKK